MGVPINDHLYRLLFTNNPNGLALGTGNPVYQFKFARYSHGEFQLASQPLCQFWSLLNAWSNFCPHMELICAGGDHKLVPIPYLGQLHQELLQIEWRKLNTAYFNLLDPAAPEESGRLAVSRVSGIVMPMALVTIRLDDGIDMLEVPAALDRSRGDIHAAGNPHYLADPENAKIVAQTIAEAFARLDPGSGAAYQENAGKFIERLDAKLAEWRKLLAPYRGAHMVAYHNSWPYFAWRFELKIDLFLEPKPGIPPSPAHLANVISRMKELGARVILHDPYLNRRTAETVARSAGARVVDVTQYPGGIKGTDGGYIEMMDRVVRAIAEALAEQ